MSTTRSITLALAAAAAFATPLLAGATANAQERVIADRAVAQPQPPTSQRMTKQLARRLASAFAVRSSFDEVQIFERENVIAVFIPEPTFGVAGPALHVKVRPPADPEEVREQLWG